jgi:hypothetical protein
MKQPYVQARRATARKTQYYASSAVLSGLVLAATALVNRQLAKSAERDNPPAGHFLEINGVRLHYVERGAGEAVVLLHGNGSMIQDFESSGLLEMASKSYRAVAFDRPGFGHSTRPKGKVWTPEAQAELIYRALQLLGAPGPSCLDTHGELQSR